MGNGVKLVALTLLNRLILELDNYYFILALSRNIISIFLLYLNLLLKTNVVHFKIMMFIMDLVLI